LLEILGGFLVVLSGSFGLADVVVEIAQLVVEGAEVGEGVGGGRGRGSGGSAARRPGRA
jgi:hypothetical protein